MDKVPLGYHATTKLAFADAEQRLREALAAEGFGVITEIDMQATLKEKLGVDLEPYKILGACNPELSYEALKVWHGFGMVMPCNVVLQDAGDHRVMLAFDPMELQDLHDQGEVLEVAKQVRDGLQRALAAVES
jgi:uncharacterized protein (DUF302 family)